MSHPAAATMTMPAAGAGQDPSLLPRPPGGNRAGAALALAVHAALLLALTVSVDWRARTPESVSAELWASVPQVAAPQGESPQPTPPAPAPTPAPPPPPPAPSPAPKPAPAPAPAREAERRPDPQIAIERERERRAEARRKEQEEAAERERERVAAEKKKQLQQQQADAEQRKKAQAEQQRKLADQQKTEKLKAEKQQAEKARADEERLARQRSENLRRMMGQAGSGEPTSAGTAARSAGISGSYGGRLQALIRPLIVYTGNTAESIKAEVEVRTAPGGSILSRRIVKASGVREWDEAVLRAIDKAGRLPPDTNGQVPPLLELTFKPND